MKPSIIIIGAGLSGLYAATLLQDKYHVRILEARGRIGGRVLTVNEHDLGPSWIWSHHKHMLALIHANHLELFPQYSKGDALFQNQSIERFSPPPQAPSARLKGGIGALIDTLASQVKADTIFLDHAVAQLTKKDDTIELITKQGLFEADMVINTLSPRLAAALEYQPPLSQSSLTLLASVPTWMGAITKVVVEYSHPFWRDVNLSGFVFSHSTPLGEIHDASTQTKGALFGFVSAKYRGVDLQNDVIRQLTELFGPKAQEFSDFLSMNWSEEVYTAVEEDKRALSQHPDYGYELSHFDGKLIFIGTESSSVEGGYLEGALHSAKSCAQRLWYCDK